MKKKFWSVLFTLMFITTASAHDFELGGIYYNITDETNKTVAVTHYGTGETSVPDEYLYEGSVVIPATVSYNGVDYKVTAITDWAFESCEDLTVVTIPESVTSIGQGAFWSSGITSMTIHENVAEIGMNAFAKCKALTTVDYNAINCTLNILTEDGYCAPIFMNSPNITVFNIGDLVETIPDYLVYRCENITNITIPESVTSIGSCAFENCVSLTEITIPRNVTSIGGGAFWFCIGLTEITCLATTPPTIEINTFESIDKKTIPLYVPEGSVDAYESAKYWKEFTNILPESSGVVAIKDDNVAVTVDAGTLRIEGVAETVAVNIYNVGGALLQATTVAQVADIVLPRGIYLVEVDNVVTKVVL